MDTINIQQQDFKALNKLCFSLREAASSSIVTAVRAGGSKITDVLFVLFQLISPPRLRHRLRPFVFFVQPRQFVSCESPDQVGFSLAAFLLSQSNSICTKDNWTALLCISLRYCKLGGTSVESERGGGS